VIQSDYEKLAELAQAPEALDKSVAYLQEKLSLFLKKNERVLILFPKMQNAASRIMERAIQACQCEPIWIGTDMRWMTMLKKAFTTRSSCIVGPPLMLLGLSKLAKHMATPLFVTNVVMAGYPSVPWLVEGVRKNLDCMAWGCFDPWDGTVISGFTCCQLDGVHIRTSEYSVEIESEDGTPMTAGETGRVVLHPNADPNLRLLVGDQGRLDTESCSCGNPEPKLVDLDVIKMGNEELNDLGENLLYWSSILDCRMERTELGMELELVVFPGEKLPRLPSVAKQIIRPFDPERDEPFAHQEELRKRFSL
jgi:hypothetical protein